MHLFFPCTPACFVPHLLFLLYPFLTCPIPFIIVALLHLSLRLLRSSLPFSCCLNASRRTTTEDLRDCYFVLCLGGPNSQQKQMQGKSCLGTSGSVCLMNSGVFWEGAYPAESSHKTLSISSKPQPSVH